MLRVEPFPQLFDEPLKFRDLVAALLYGICEGIKSVVRFQAGDDLRLVCNRNVQGQDNVANFRAGKVHHADYLNSSPRSLCLPYGLIISVSCDETLPLVPPSYTHPDNW